MPRFFAVIGFCAVLSACGGGARFEVSPEPLKFMSIQRGRTTTVVETRVPARLTFAQFARAEPQMIRRALNGRRIEVRRVRFGGRRALHITYRVGTKGIEQYFVRAGERMYVVTYTARTR